MLAEGLIDFGVCRDEQEGDDTSEDEDSPKGCGNAQETEEGCKESYAMEIK